MPVSNEKKEFSNADSVTNDDRPQGSDTFDNSYTSGKNDGPVTVVPDETPVEQPNLERDPDSDQSIERDEADAIDKSNILKGGRTRGATKPSGTYQEPGDEQGLPPPDDGRSSTR